MPQLATLPPATWDHEYEPITPMPEPPPPAKLPEIETKKEHILKKALGRHRPKAKEKRRVIKIPNSDQVIIPLHGESDEEINPDRYEKKQEEEEEQEPEAVDGEETETTGGPATSSQLDTSELEQLPLDKAARASQQQTETGPKGFGQRIRSHAGRIRSRISSMPKPKFEKPKIKMPEKPKFLSEKPKFLTERPKFLKETPKLKMPQRPKFLKERPAFKMPQRPKFNIKRPDISMPKFDFVKKKNRQGTPPTKQKPKPTSSLKRPLKDHPSTTMSSSGSKRNLFEAIKYRTYPRFLNRRKKDRGKRASTPPPRMTATESSPQSSPETRRPTRRYQDTKWVETLGAMKYVDETGSERKGSNNYSGTEENVEQFDEETGYLKNVVRLEDGHKFMKAKAESASSVVDSDKEQASSQGSSTARRRAGVLEEIDSDEFFLREKGLSREDVDVSRYLSLEIRDAFRSPKNALASLDTDLYYDEDYDEDEEPEAPKRKKNKESKPPERSKSAERRRQSDGSEKQQDFNTFPMRPSRRKQSEPLVATSSATVEKPPRKYRSKSDTRQASMPSLHTRSDEEQPPRPPSRRRSAKDLSKKMETDEITTIVPASPHSACSLEPERETEVQEMEVQRTELAPMAPLRKERSRGTSVGDEDRTSRGVESLQSEVSQDELAHEVTEVEEVGVEVEEPEIESKMEAGMEVPGYATVAKVRPPRPPPPPPTRQRKLTPMVTPLRNIKNHGMNFFFTYPRRAIKSLQKPPTRPVRNYSTLGPSRPPRRNRVFREPVYVDGDKETSAGDKKIKDDDLEELEDRIIAELAREDDENRDLQRGEVVEKMKGRPLPPPPRPPRKPKDYESLKRKKKIGTVEDYTKEEEEEEEEEVCQILREATKEMAPIHMETTRLVYRENEPELSHHPTRDDFFSVFSRIKPPPEPDVDRIEDETQDKTTSVQQQTSFDIDTDIMERGRQEPVSEVTVSVQTDPLPEDFIVDEQETGSLAFEPTATAVLLETINEIEVEPAVRPERRRKQEPLGSQPLPERETPENEGRVSERVVVQQLIPERLHLTELEVEKLSVNEIQAKKIIVSDIDGQTMQVSEVSSKSGNLVLNGVELPPDLLQSLASQVAAEMGPGTEVSSKTERRGASPKPQPIRMVTPPPPIVVSPSSPEIMPLPQRAESIGTDAQDYMAKPKSTRSKGRKYNSRAVDDSEDELATVMRDQEEQEKSSWCQIPEESEKKEEQSRLGEKTEKEETASRALELSSEGLMERKPISRLPMERRPTSTELLGQLLAIWQATLAEGAATVVRGINSVFPEAPDKRRDAQTAACILLVLIAGLIMIGFGTDNTVHHHHWDYVPPKF
ncbi:hypothetical protein AAG570_012306 [Ranatra chinensis]|uniref:Uncharacterized protein n=1 Tax=Ranatra chinensis TaxID=642074 RepID=A0ABD0Z6R8_9HEMI